MDALFEASRVQREQALFAPTPLIELSAPAINIGNIFALCYNINKLTTKGDKEK